MNMVAFKRCKKTKRNVPKGEKDETRNRGSSKRRKKYPF